MEIGEDEVDNEPSCNQQHSQLSYDDETSVFSPLSDSNSYPWSTLAINDEGTQQPVASICSAGALGFIIVGDNLDETVRPR